LMQWNVDVLNANEKWRKLREGERFHQRRC